jgi:hypothetical protein
VAELGTPHGALEHGQLLTECQILERDRSVAAADQRERSKRDDERSQHELSCPAISHRINRSRDLILANDRTDRSTDIIGEKRIHRGPQHQLPQQERTFQ